MTSDRAPRSDRTRNDERILRAAAETLARDPAATMAHIAADAGIDRRTIYRRYPSREALVDGMRRQVGGELMAALDAFGGWERPDALRDLIGRLVDVAHRYPVAARRHDPDAAASPVDARIVALLRAGQAAGVLRAGADPHVLNGMILGTVAAAVATGRGDRPKVVADRVAGLLADGLGA